ncbi:chemotaxis protein CheA [Desulfurivibrio alkaliphilus]|uniref:Chemotaxis protein CheA n=1 Tax=Desulfurivibrio alkaliphilus (strain DSM 19089 / UNIQEM U267 / AHT2) TaxID=589865 RepID=D6Z1B2_DESAT|nr:chemotaxis protein CheA [Desulfurivibrio alkaliphilus]ADH85367.1 CheA signal transduction histidine kinase [Desulfurivibrio alkaliphilus AHT 2]
MASQISADQLEIIREFIQECTDLLDHLEPVIVGFGEFTRDGDFTPGEENMAILHEVFRLFHSIKGSAGFLNFSHMSTTAHAAENLLDKIRKGEMAMNAGHVDLLCATCDFMRGCLDEVATGYSDEGMAAKAAELTGSLKHSLAADSPATAPAAPASSPGAAPRSAGGAEAAAELEIEVTPEMITAFVQEAGEQLQALEEGFLAWSDKGEEATDIGELYRKMHSFKGNCGFVGLADLERLSHRMETVLDVVKAGSGKARAKPADALLNLCDVLKEALTDLAAGGQGKIDGLDLYLDLLNDLIPTGWGDNPVRSRAPKLGEILLAQGRITEDTLDEALSSQARPLGEILVEKGAVTPEDVNQALASQQQAAGAPRPAAAPPPALKRQDLRVDLEKIDTLINLIGELVISENMLVNNPDLEGLELENFAKTAQQMGKIVKELQEVSMAIRMIPVSGLFNRMTRLVHDLSRKSGKKAELVLGGTETEVDKTVIEKVTDPLVHLIRNSMDHGLENGEERKAAGKPPTGTLRLSASHEEGAVLIRLEDDGRGLNRDKILAKAREKGLLDGDGSELSDKEVAAMIFQPGFSTADQVTDVSGRGVGMDVVKQNLNQIKGKIDIDSQPGRGTVINLRIPLTMAILDGMMVQVGTSRYIIPTLSIRESFRPAPEAVTVNPDGLEMVRVRENFYPVIRLHELHQIEAAVEELGQGILVLLENQDRCICLLVDEIIGQQQTVIKGLSEYIGRIGQASCVSGCTIMGNGEVCLILDVGSLTEL